MWIPWPDDLTRAKISHLTKKNRQLTKKCAKRQIALNDYNVFFNIF